MLLCSLKDQILPVILQVVLEGLGAGNLSQALEPLCGHYWPQVAECPSAPCLLICGRYSGVEQEKRPVVPPAPLQLSCHPDDPCAIPQKPHYVYMFGKPLR